MQRKLKVSTLQRSLQRERKKHKTIGFVPTMGALHEGHLSLIRAARLKSDITVCSIFVNPTQFNEKKDLEKYPRTLKSDLDLLEKAGCHYVFTPNTHQIYPKNENHRVDIDLAGLDTLMEGKFRPGHFAGVVQVVKRLLDIVQPDQLYMGQKDFQQFTIIRHMINTLGIPTELVVCPIARETSGLAMSSRNRRLSDEQRKKAAIIYRTLKQAGTMLETHTPKQLELWAMEQLDTPPLRPEYFKIVDGKSLRPISSFDQHDYVVACTAVWAGEVRLIDNMILKH